MSAKIREKQFDEFYQEQYGHERWQQLKKALMKPNTYACLINRYAESKMVMDRLKESPQFDQMIQLPFISVPCLALHSSDQIKTIDEEDSTMVFLRPKQDFMGLSSYYLLDSASVLVSEALDVQAGHSVLDLCAAPGGKSIAIAQRLCKDGQLVGHLVCNEMNNARRKRLWKVLRDYLPANLFQSVDGIDRDNGKSSDDVNHVLGCLQLSSNQGKVEVTGRDGSRYAQTCPQLFDRILVDAPCSSERHLLHDTKTLNELWTPSRSKKLAQTQLPILMEACRLLKPGGRLVYATCSLSRLENDDLVAKAVTRLKEKEGLVMEVSSRRWVSRFHKHGKRKWPIGEPTKYGWIVLPDHEAIQVDDNTISFPSPGWGPMYFATLDRLID